MPGAAFVAKNAILVSTDQLKFKSAALAVESALKGHPFPQPTLMLDAQPNLAPTASSSLGTSGIGHFVKRLMKS